jgi:rare lipoprotein A
LCIAHRRARRDGVVLRRRVRPSHRERRAVRSERHDGGAPHLPFGTLLRGTYRGRSVVVRINDRGPFVKKGGHFTRDIDLSEGAARRIGLPGVGEVTVEVIDKTELYIPKHGDWGVF